MQQAAEILSLAYFESVTCQLGGMEQQHQLPGLNSDQPDCDPSPSLLFTA